MKTNKICLISNVSLSLRPHLLRMVTALDNAGYEIKIFCQDKKSKIKGLDPDLKINKTFNLSNISPYPSCLKKLAPILDIVRMGITMRFSNIKYYNLFIVCHPYSLAAAYIAGVPSQKIVYYSAEIWDGIRLLHLQAIEKILLKKIIGVVAPLKERINVLVSRYRLYNTKTFVLPNSTYDYNNNIKANKTKVYDNDENINFIYQGTSNIYRRCLEILIEVFGEKEKSTLILALGGEVKYINKIKLLIKGKKHPENFIINDFVAYPRHFTAAFKCDVGIMFYNSTVSINYALCAPNKLYEYAMLGLPILSSNQPHLTEIIEKFNFGISVDPHDKNQIKNSTDLLSNRETLKRMSCNARKWYLQYGNYRHHAAQFDNWLKDI